MTRSRRVLAALVTGGAVLVMQAEAPAAGPPSLTRPVQATKVDLDPGRLYYSPAMAVDPRNPLRIVGRWADLRTRRCGIVRSTDGGQTWVRPDAAPNTATFPFCAMETRIRRLDGRDLCQPCFDLALSPVQPVVLRRS